MIRIAPILLFLAIALPTHAADIDTVRSACNAQPGKRKAECLSALNRLVPNSALDGGKITAKPGSDEIARAETKITAMLNDPESARFGAVEMSPSTKAVCGLVNAKNAMGGYGQPKRFLVTTDFARIEGDEVWKFNIRWAESCPEF